MSVQVDNSHLKKSMNARPTNVESAIPRTKERDPANYPYEYREYPKAMNMKCDQAYLDAWMERNKQFDDHGRPYWTGGRPKVDVSIVAILDELGEPLFVADEDEEREFRAAHPEALEIVGVQAEMDGLRADNDRLRALADENARLKAELAERNQAPPNQQEPPADSGGKIQAAVVTGGVVADAGKNGDKKKFELPKKL